MTGLTIGTVVLGVDDVPRATTFWREALGYVPRDPDSGPTWVVLIPPNGEPGTRLALGLSETAIQEHPRVHLDLYTTDQSGEVERLLALGAQRVDWDLYPKHADFVVLADTEGNRFCVIDKGPLDARRLDVDEARGLRGSGWAGDLDELRSSG